VTPSRIVAALAVLVGLATLARATRCTAGGELLIGITLTGVLAAVWNDNREGGLAARIVKFIIVLVLAGGFVGFFAVALHVRCVAVVGPTRSQDTGARVDALIQGLAGTSYGRCWARTSDLLHVREVAVGDRGRQRVPKPAWLRGCQAGEPS
jgi:hypothetical protein